MLGAAQPDALGPERAGVGGVLAGVGIGPDGEFALADLVGPQEDGDEGGRWRRRREGHLAGHHNARSPVEGHPVALLEGHVADRHRVRRQAKGLGPDHRRLAPAAGHDGGMADQAATCGQDPLRRQHPVHVLGGRLAAHQHDLLAPLGRGGRVVGGEIDPSHGGPGAGPEPLGPHGIARPGELGVEDRVEMVLGDARHGLGLGDPEVTRAHHVDSHLQCSGAGALAHPRLEHPQLALLNGEFGVAHVAVVALEAGEDVEELAVHLGELLLELGDRLGVADAGHHVFTLGVQQEVAVGPLGSGGRVAGEADPRARVVVAVAEDHGLHVDGGAQVVGDALTVPVGDGPRAVPAPEDRLDRTAQLRGRVLGEGRAGVALDRLLVGVHQVAQELGRHLGVRCGPGELLGRVEEGVELPAGQFEHDPPVHGDETAVRVVGEALIAGLLSQALDGAVVETQVQDSVHHAGHGELGTRAHRDQEGVGGVADDLAHGFFQVGPGLGHLAVETLGPAPGHVGAAGVRRDGESRRHGKGQYRRHLGQVGALAAEEVLELHGRPSVLVVEIEDVRHRASLPWHGGPPRTACMGRVLLTPRGAGV